MVQGHIVTSWTMIHLSESDDACCTNNQHHCQKIEIKIGSFEFQSYTNSLKRLFVELSKVNYKYAYDELPEINC